MKSLPLLITILTLSTLSVACDTTSTDVNRDSVIQEHQPTRTAHQTNIQAASKETSIRTNQEVIDTSSSIEWEPRVINTPSGKRHKPFIMPVENVQKVKDYFYNDVDMSEVKERDLKEYENEFFGYIRYFDDTEVGYSFKKNNGDYSSDRLVVGGIYESSNNFSSFHKNIIYKMLEVSDVDNPVQFFQELLDSPKITKYKGCIVRQKAVKYGVIDITSCEDDDATSITLFNPDLAK